MGKALGLLGGIVPFLFVGCAGSTHMFPDVYECAELNADAHIHSVEVFLRSGQSFSVSDFFIDPDSASWRDPLTEGRAMVATRAIREVHIGHEDDLLGSRGILGALAGVVTGIGFSAALPEESSSMTKYAAIAGVITGWLADLSSFRIVRFRERK